MKLSEIKPNPNNPRLVKDEKFKKLCNSIQEFPKMMELRPIIIDDDNIILGGNMRFKALKELKYKEVPDNWIKSANQLTDDEKRRFIIADNVGVGEWDFDLLSNEWDENDLSDWGMDLPLKNQLKKEKQELQDFKKSHILISYHPDQHILIQEILEKLNNIPEIEIENGSN